MTGQSWDEQYRKETLSCLSGTLSSSCEPYLRFALRNYDDLVLVRKPGDKEVVARKLGTSVENVSGALKALREADLYE